VIGIADNSWLGQRDHLLLGMLYNTGARVSEIIGVQVADVVLDGAACVHLRGKGRKTRSVPLWRSSVKEIRAWLKQNANLRPTSALLPNRNGEAMTRSNVTQRLAIAVSVAAKTQPQLTKRPISPHTIAVTRRRCICFSPAWTSVSSHFGLAMKVRRPLTITSKPTWP